MIYLLRHGQTDWNKIHRLQGITDIPLNDTGRQMARDAYAKYKDISFDCCYSSPLVRAYETAELFLGDRNTPIIKDERFREMNFGPYEGTYGYFTDETHPLYSWFTAPETYVQKDGVETFEEMTARAVAGVENIRKNHDISKENILIAGHGAMCASIICYYKHMPLKDFWDALLKNCELYELEV